MLFGEKCWMNREGVVDLVSCALTFWESVGCPAVQQYRRFGVFATFFQDQLALDSVAFHMCLWTDRGVFHASAATQTSVMPLCGVQRMESDVRVWSWRSVTQELSLCHL